MLGIQLWLAIDKPGKFATTAASRLMMSKEDGQIPTEWNKGEKSCNDVIVGRCDGNNFTVADYR